MTRRHRKGSDGKYHIKGKTYEVLIGSRAQVHHKTAYKTTGGLKYCDLVKNKHGKIVSKLKSSRGAKTLKRLTNKGYNTKKGKFGWIRGSCKKSQVRRRKRVTKKRKCKKRR
jgi:hypothetical protein